jgi:hypothetical protein
VSLWLLVAEKRVTTEDTEVAQRNPKSRHHRFLLSVLYCGLTL